MDTIKITILKDGTIRSVTGEFDAANHQQAEDFIRMVGQLVGADEVRVPTEGSEHVHQHQHGEVHHHG